MAIAEKIRLALSSASPIRKIFEEGLELKKIYGAAKVFDFSLGNPDLEPPPAFKQTLRDLLDEDRAGLHGYMPNAGHPYVRAALAEKVSLEHNISVPPEHIVLSVGAAGALNVVLKALLNPGDEVLVPKPYFMEYKAYVANHQGVLVEIEPAARFSLNIAAIETALSSKTQAVLINSPHNPTGQVYSAALLGELAGLLERHGQKTGRFPYLIADEPYRALVYGGVKVPPVLPLYRNTLVITSYSKSLSLPGERIGYIAAAPNIEQKEELVSALAYATRILGFVNAPALMQRCVARLVHESTDIAVYARRRAVFIEVLEAAGLTYLPPDGAFYLFVKVPAPSGLVGDDNAFVEHLKKRLILSVPGSAFGAKGWVRFAYCVNEALIQASKIPLQEAVNEWNRLHHVTS